MQQLEVKLACRRQLNRTCVTLNISKLHLKFKILYQQWCLQEIIKINTW